MKKTVASDCCLFSVTKLPPSPKNSFPNQKNVYAKSEN